jgi:hypothetical protein
VQRGFAAGSQGMGTAARRDLAVGRIAELDAVRRDLAGKALACPPDYETSAAIPGLR